MAGCAGVRQENVCGVVGRCAYGQGVDIGLAAAAGAQGKQHPVCLRACAHQLPAGSSLREQAHMLVLPVGWCLACTCLLAFSLQAFLSLTLRVRHVKACKGKMDWCCCHSLLLYSMQLGQSVVALQPLLVQQ